MRPHPGLPRGASSVTHMSTQAVLVGGSPSPLPGVETEQLNPLFPSPLTVGGGAGGPSLMQTWEEKETWVSAKGSFAGKQTAFPAWEM